MPIELIRNGKRQTVTATVGKRPPEDQLANFNVEEDTDPLDQAPSTEQASSAALGMQLLPLTPQIRRDLRLNGDAQGMVVARVDPSSDAAGKGLQRGFLIRTINQRPVTNQAEVNAIVTEARQAKRDSVLLYVQSPQQSQSIYIAVALAGS